MQGLGAYAANATFNRSKALFLNSQSGMGSFFANPQRGMNQRAVLDLDMDRTL